MASSEIFVKQTIFKAHHPPFSVISCHESQLPIQLPSFLLSVNGVVGLSADYGANCRMTSLAIASATKVLVVTFSNPKGRSEATTGNILHRGLLKSLLADVGSLKVALQMDQIATALYSDHQLHIRCGKDLLSLSKASRDSIEGVMNALGGEATLCKPAVITAFLRGQKEIAMKAWAVCRAAVVPHVLVKLAKSPSIDTIDFDIKVLKVISKSIRDAARLVALKPVRVKNDIIKETKVHKGGNLAATSQRYKTRLMCTSPNQTLEIKTIEADGSSRVLRGTIRKVDGCNATIKLKGAKIGNAKIQSLETVGRDRPLTGEMMRESYMLSALQSTISLSANPFISTIWLPGNKVLWAPVPQWSTSPPLYFPTKRSLNVSQAQAVRTILSNEDRDRVVLIQGPPGTGKTTVIAATVTSTMNSGDKSRTIWLVAHSNVAVKNMAEKLASLKFFDFKILVSKDFHNTWHEHLYEEISKNLIRSDDFPSDRVAVQSCLKGSRVILCTLAMLSNNKLAHFARQVPLQTVIFDEASQIEIGAYFPMLFQFRPTLRKLVFIGDDKQLAPYGISDIPELESIFEKPGLRDRVVFLNTQYRIPIPIGDFISKRVYNGALKSQHAIGQTSCCRFVDVADGGEESEGRSYINKREVTTVIEIARQLIAAKQSFRIITPYDSQRSLLEGSLQDARLTWEDKCFNIDSFQGNEDDFIIISLVRSKKIGFLQEQRRVNVMLTRFKKGMIICTNRNFMQNQAAGSLVGKLATTLGSTAWIESRKVLHHNVRPFTV